jgi:hypothetical protein
MQLPNLRRMKALSDHPLATEPRTDGQKGENVEPSLSSNVHLGALILLTSEVKRGSFGRLEGI